MNRRTVPSWLRLSADQVRDLSIVHHQNLDTMAKGQADEEVMWQWAAGVLTWWRAAELVGAGAVEMQPQLDLVASVVERFRRTGKVGFSGPEYQLAKQGVDVMDALASITTKVKAIEAAGWSERRAQQCADGAAWLWGRAA